MTANPTLEAAIERVHRAVRSRMAGVVKDVKRQNLHQEPTKEAVREAAEFATVGSLPLLDLNALLADHATQAARIAELEANLAVIGKAAERSQRLFGGSMSEVTKVFEHIARVARLPAGAVKPAAPSLPADVVALVIKGRAMFDTFHGYGDHASCAQVISEFDNALEAFSSRVPYEDDPTALAPFADRVAGGRAMSGLKSMNVTIFFPLDMDVGPDRARWYVEGAIRGWWQGFATANDPIRKMRAACVVFPAPPAAVAEQTDGEG